MDTALETSVTVEQLPPPITLSTDSASLQVAGEPTVTIDVTHGDIPEPPTDNGQPHDRLEVESHAPADVSPPARPPPPEEHAYWAEIEEDTSLPDEAEMKEIESSADVSSCDYEYWEKNFHPELDDPEYHPAEKARLTWKIKGVRGTKESPNYAKIIRSPPAYVGGYWWTIKFFPRGNNVNSLSIYLECSATMPVPDKTHPETEFAVVQGPADSDLQSTTPALNVKYPRSEDSTAWLDHYNSHYLPTVEQADPPTDTWRVSAQIGVILYNPDEPRTAWQQASCHQFNPHNLDWGWTNFHAPWDEIHRRQRGQRQPLLRNDTLAFDAYIRVIDDPTRSLWWHCSDSEPTWDSLSLTGYRPLGDSVINHSAEVAGLATWLHIAPFCKIIQNVNVLEHLTNCDVKPKPLCDALQKFLWHLRSRGKSLQYVDTDTITSTLRNLHEYSGDVCEFWERLRRTLELELAGTDAVKDLAAIFDSPTPQLPSAPADGEDVINTIPKDFNSRICVPADQAGTMHEALDWYLGQKPGRWALPPILHVELGRQKLDKAARQWRLLYNRVELDEELDLAPRIVDGQSGKYVLYGYIVHRGRRTSGKFFSILRPGGPGSKWLAFDDGSDNRVECLTRKTALGPHVGLDSSQNVDHKTGHDVAIAAMYIRDDAVQEYLPGPQGPWEVNAALKGYYENGVYPLSQSPDEKLADDIQVEIYSVPQYDKLDSLFDTYDLMSQAKTANNVMYLTVPRSTNLIDLRKKIAQWASAGAESTTIPEHVRLWQIGHTLDRFGPTLAFSRVSDLKTTLDLPLKVARFWMQVVSEVDAKYFAMKDPQDAITTESNKPEEAILEREDSDSADDHTPAREGDAAQASSSGTSPAADLGDGPGTAPVATEASTSEDHSEGRAQTPVPAAPEPDSNGTANGEAVAENTDNDAVIAAIIADDVQQMDTEGPSNTEPTPEQAPQLAPAEPEPPTADATPTIPTEPEIILPVDHVYYFIQMFDVDTQSLRTVGSFFSQKEDNIKSAVRKHLKWPARKDFLIWQRLDGTTVTTMSSAETFEGFVPDGTCFIVGDRLNKDRRAELNVTGLFANPDQLVRYLWASARSHPTKAFTGTKTINATFTNDYYSGDFKNGYFHGKGTHVTDSAATYAGDHVFGKRHGKGYMEYPTGDTYDGDWFENQCHGQGAFVEKKTGNKYVGGYKDGKRHGKGISYWEVADEEINLCQICYSEEQDALFYDCGHVCACVTCARQVDICPICRKNIISVVKIYRT
ncbi:putative MATH and UCH domain protein [Aspergillus affinis]|uniref:putative MATH and UCH domain protein n=1 Tax=Aspergillus affinis TaxID=1070780 RepID=UPI0022FEF11E|nr:putative MATH and UCH domain protein [Aspergillus affinis]KAI9042090.1 putative MATH and UCH domain protein [Aspergillus affinis]